jgi:S4 domain protein YaaA
MKQILISTPFITLGQLLKYAGMLQSGGEIKHFLAQNAITVNQVEENRRGRKLYPGDEIIINQTVSLRIGPKQ